MPPIPPVISPVEGSIVSPLVGTGDVNENTPPEVPVTVAEFVLPSQKSVSVKVASSNGLTVISKSTLTPWQELTSNSSTERIYVPGIVKFT